MAARRPAASSLKSRSLEARIAARIHSMRPSEQKTAKFFSTHSHELPFMSSSQIAKVLSVSNTTVVRTAQALGYAGLPELRAELRTVLEDHLAERVGSPLPATKNGHAFDRLVNSYAEFLQTTMSSVPGEEVDRAVELLRRAERVGVYGVGMYASLAAHFVQRLARSGRLGYLITQMGVAVADDLLQMRKGDVLVVMSYAPHTNEALRLTLERAKELRLRTILVIDTLVRPLLKGDYELALATGRRVEGWITVVGTVVLLEALLVGLATSDPARNRRSLATLTDLQERIRPRSRTNS